MKGRTLVILAVVAVVMIVAAVYVRRDEAVPPDAIGRLVLGEVPLNDIAAIVVTGSDSTTRLARVDNVWVSQNAHNYPTDFKRIRDAVIKLADLKIGQVIDVDDAERAEMKLLPPTAEAAGTGTLVELFDAAGTRLARLLVGESRKRQGGGGPQFGGPQFGGYPDGQYVATDDDSVYLVTENLHEFTRSASEWLDKELLNVPATDVAGVTISGIEGGAVTLRVPEGGSALALADLGEDEEMDTSRASSVKSSLSYLRFDDVADPSLGDEALGLDTPIEFKAETTAGTVYTVLLGGKVTDSENRYARVSAVHVPEPETTPAGTGDETGDEATDEAAAEDAARLAEERLKTATEVEALNAKLGPWTYVISSYKADYMTSTRDQLVKEPEPPEDAETEAEEPAS